MADASPEQSTLSQALARAVEESEATVSSDTLAALMSWLLELQKWNARIDLTAARGELELVDLMIADALLLARHLPQGARFVDVGSGAGAPGLPLSILRPDLTATLVEPLDKRVAFLRRSIGALSRPGRALPEVFRGRGEMLVEQGRTFDVAISRATLPPPAWLALGAKLAPNGGVWVLLAQGDVPVIEGLRVASDHVYTWPLTGVHRRAVLFVKGFE